MREGRNEDIYRDESGKDSDLLEAKSAIVSGGEGHYGKFVVKAVQVTSQSQSLRHSRCYCPLRAGCL